MWKWFIDVEWSGGIQIAITTKTMSAYTLLSRYHEYICEWVTVCCQCGKRVKNIHFLKFLIFRPNKHKKKVSKQKAFSKMTEKVEKSFCVYFCHSFSYSLAIARQGDREEMSENFRAFTINLFSQQREYSKAIQKLGRI